jgi:transposase
MTLSVYCWEDVHLYFPQKVVEQYRKQIIEEWKSDKFKDREIWELYGMSESVFYDLVKRYSKEEDLKDKPSKPKNPSHKLEQEEYMRYWLLQEYMKVKRELKRIPDI